MASFMALLRCGRRHDEGKKARKTQANCGANPPHDTGRDILAETQSAKGLTDTQLLKCFVERRESEAFAALM
jgi:hypothetical protein